MLQHIAMMDLFLDTADAVTPKVIIYALAGVVATLAGVIAAMGNYIAKTSKANQKRVDELYEARISDLKEAHDLVDTLMGVITRKGS